VAFTPSLGFGGLLEIDRDDAGDWADVGQIVDAGLLVNGVEVETTHSRTGEAGVPLTVTPPYWEDYIPGWHDFEFRFLAVLDVGSAKHEDTILDHLAVIRHFRYTYGNGQKIAFDAFYRDPSFNVPNEERIEVGGVLRIDGLPDFNATW
jgi:hypothetical protein